MTPPVACAVCDQVGAVRRGTGRDVTLGTVAALAEAVPVVDCPAGHTAPAPVADAAVDAARDQLPRATRPRLRHTDRCARCGTTLSMPVRRTDRPVTLEGLPGCPVVTVRFDLPTTRCPDCGLDQVPTRSDGDVDAALRELFAPERGQRPPTAGA